MIRPLCALLVIAQSSACASGGGATDAHAFDGAWTATSAELAGGPFPDQIWKGMKLVIADGTYTVTLGPAVDKGTLKFDPAKSPKALDIVGTDGPNKGRTILAIYEKTGDSLRICYDLGGQTRPAEFKTTKGTQLFLVTYDREKK
jgi:uncharacterized protein (TIGR03067 family)